MTPECLPAGPFAERPTLAARPAGHGDRSRIGHAAKRSERLALNQDYQGLGQDPVIRHRFPRLFGLHRGHDRIHVGNIHQDPDPRRLFRGSELVEPQHKFLDLG